MTNDENWKYMCAQVRKLSKEELESIVNDMHATLYPNGDMEHEWTPDTIHEVSQVLSYRKIQPDTFTGPDAEEEDGACSPGCPGYSAFDAGRSPHPNLVYTHDTRLEIERCDACGIFEDDDAAFAAWVAAGRPKL